MKLLLTKASNYSLHLLTCLKYHSFFYGSYFVYAGSLAKEEMVDLRKAMPSIPHVLRKLHTDQDNNKLSMFQAKLCAARYVATKCFLG